MIARERILDLLRKHGWNATSFQTLEQSFEYWFDGDDAAVAYVNTGGAWVVAGPPIAPDERLGAVARRFVEHGARQRRRVSFFAVEKRFLRAIGMRSIPIGEQPRWNPQRWNDQHRGHRSFREQLRRARAKGVVVERLATEDVERNRADIERLIARWLGARKMPAMSFLVELTPFSFAAERRYYAARRERKLVGFLVAVPVFLRDGWFIEDILRDPSAPNGTAESLVHAAMADVAGDGATFATLGLAPLAGEARWQKAIRWSMEGFYNFEGLRAFKARLRPEAWDPIFLAWPGDAPAVLAVFDALNAFAGGKLVRFALRSFLRAPAAALFVLGVLAVPWSLMLALLPSGEWFPSRGVQCAWVVFDLTMAAVLVALSRRWRRPLAIAASIAMTADVVLTTAQVVAYNARRVRRWQHALGIGLAVAAPVAVLALLAGGIATRSR